jgi:hypothetical protein
VALLAWQLLRPAQAAKPWPTAGALAVVGSVIAIVGVPLVYLLASAASIALPTFAAVIAVFIALLGSLLVPHYRRLTGRRLWVAPAALTALAVLCAIGVQLSTGYGPSRPRPDYIQYTLDADTGRATWLSAGTGTDGWTEQFFDHGYTQRRDAFSPGYYFGQSFDVIEAPAPRVNLAAPRLSVLDDTTTDGLRTLRLRLTSARAAPMAHLDLALPGDLVAATVGGQTVKLDPNTPQRRLPIAAYNLGDDGIELSISVRATATITGTLTDYSNGLPDIAGMTVRDRPAEFMPGPFDFRDPTAVRTSIEL